MTENKGTPLKPVSADQNEGIKKNKNKPKRSRSLMYVQQVKHLPAHFKSRDDITNHLNKNFPDAEWAYVLHDKDFKVVERNGIYEYELDAKGDKILVEQHIHIGLHFPNPRTPSGIAMLMGEPKQDNGKTVEVFDGRWGKANMFAYLIHATDKAKMELKHEYDISEVTANFDFTGFMGRTKDTADANKLNIDDIQARIISGELVLKDFFVDGKLGSAEVAGLFYTNNDTKINKAIDTRYKLQMSKKGDSDLEIIYIQGPPGSGKTTIAKAYADRKYGDYFVTGSSNDAVQDYRGEPVAIFDDARPSDFNASDWLKMLDPYNNKSSVTSRYYNKYLAVNSIILTTTTDFKEFFLYAKDKGGVDEPIDQFIRRFNVVIKADSMLDDNGKPWAIGELYEVKRVPEYSEVLPNSRQRVSLNYDIAQLPYRIKEEIPEKDSSKTAQDFTTYFDSAPISVDSSDSVEASASDSDVPKIDVRAVDKSTGLSRFA